MEGTEKPLATSQGQYRLPQDVYDLIRSRVPLVCVELVAFNGSQFLVCKRQIPPALGLWVLPGGIVYRGERLHEAVHRKAREELGVDVRILDEIGIFEVLEHEYYHVIVFDFLVRLLNEPIILDHQHSEYRWISRLSEIDLEPQAKRALTAAGGKG